METIAIVGVGLIGGSFALALREAGFTGRVLGVSSDRTVRAALELGVIDEAARLEDAARRADLMYLSGPIHGILATLPRLSRTLRPGALVTDAGSTKRRICEAGRKLEGAQFLGGHPMAGKEKRGVAEAEAGLFRGRPYLLTPAAPAEMETAAVKEFLAWITRIGAVPRVMPAEAHDRVVALASHLPQMISTALASALDACREAADVAGTAGPGLLDTTRLAMSGWEIWKDIIETNRDEIVRAMKMFGGNWERLSNEAGNGLLEEEFRRGTKFARLVRDSRQGRKRP